MRVLGWIAGLGMMAAIGFAAAQQTQVDQQAAKDQMAKRADELWAKLSAQANACPVGFHAVVGPRLTLREVKNGKQGVDSTLVRQNFSPVVATKVIVVASVTAHGLAPYGQLMRVGGSSDESRTQTFELKWDVSAAGLFQSELKVTQVPYVRWVELNQLTYADGSMWHAAEGTVCKSVLSRFHPV